jgi:hypothetical protein
LARIGHGALSLAPGGFDDGGMKSDVDTDVVAEGLSAAFILLRRRSGFVMFMVHLCE